MKVSAEPEGRDFRRSVPGTFHVAVVHSPTEIHFIVGGSSEDEVYAQLTRQLLDEVDLQLWETEAAVFRELISFGRHREAVGHYFSTVGERWDPQRLSLHSLDL